MRGRRNPDICRAIGPVPTGARTYYNDIQCGNGPANSSLDEIQCPGVVGKGWSGCRSKGPKWVWPFQIKEVPAASPKASAPVAP